MKVTTSPEDVLITYSLGSCIGLSLYDPVAHVGGLIHCMLPLSRIDLSKAKDRPCMFTDTGVTALIESLIGRGAKMCNVVARVAGASQIMDDRGTFRIGERNYTVLRKILWKNGILIAAEDIGGNAARTMALYMGDGRTTIRVNGVEKVLS